MAPPSFRGASDGARRVVLVDFDWADADLLPELLRRPGISVRLVAGSSLEDPGVRLAELCGLPRTTDLADLTREIFDLALVSERSPRRAQVEGLLTALGTPSLEPRGVLVDPAAAKPESKSEEPLGPRATPSEASPGGEWLDTLVEEALPDLAAERPTSHRAPAPANEALAAQQTPGPEDRNRLETLLKDTMADAGASRAELRFEGPGSSSTVVEAGPEDALLRGLVALALADGAAQVLQGVKGPHEGRAWGAWPFRTTRIRAVLAAAGILPASVEICERLAEELRAAWSREDRERAGPAFPMVPGSPAGWLDPIDFEQRLELAIERNRRDGLRFTLSRLDFPLSTEAANQMAGRLPHCLRETDCICRPGPRRVLVLTATSPDRLAHVRSRIAALWQQAWVETGNQQPVPRMCEEQAEMSGPEDVAGFLNRARRWLEGA